MEEQRRRGNVITVFSTASAVGKTLVAITSLPPRPMMGLVSNGMLLSALHKTEGEDRLNLLYPYNSRISGLL